MDVEFNPYAPGAGIRPAALVGRDAQIEAWRVALARLEAGKNAQPVVLYGLRGVGKTVLLSTLTALAEDRKWLVAQVEAGTGKPLRNLIGEALYGFLSDLVRPTAGDRLRKALKSAASFKRRTTPPAPGTSASTCLRYPVVGRTVAPLRAT